MIIIVIIIAHIYLCIYDISPARLATKKVFGDGQEKCQEAGKVRDI